MSGDAEAPAGPGGEGQAAIVRLGDAFGDRQAEYVDEMQRIVDATYGLIERTGGLDPSLRDILREVGRRKSVGGQPKVS